LFSARNVLFQKSRMTAPLAGFALFIRLGLGFFIVTSASAQAGEMAQDPNGFLGIRWGAKLADVPELVQVESGDRIQTYEFKNGPPRLGDARPDSLRLTAIHGQFARAAVRYRGAQTHAQILAYLETQFGPADRTPGSMMRGLNQQFNWRGPDTEVNVTYENNYERGHVFVESRTLAPRFMDTLPEHVF
jgi:hypothetical protein